ncbi:MAG: (2Fe-2S)-binding protein [Jatrophihabitans sp.]
MTLPQDLLRSAAAFGDYFAVVDKPGDDWPSLATLATDPDRLRGQVTEARAALAGQFACRVEQIEARAAASVWFLGFAARIVSPPLAVTVMVGRVPRLAADRVWAPPSGPWAMEASGTSNRQELHDVLLGGLIEPLVRTVNITVNVSAKVLWGNVASALAGAADVVGSTRPDLISAARAAVDSLLRGALLDGAGQYREDGFRRATCCLYYRLPGGGICGDCVLRDT